MAVWTPPNPLPPAKPPVSLRFLLLFICCSWIVTGCTALPGRTGDVLLRTELYFGMNRKDAAPVAPDEWRAFVDTCITREFSDGFTIVDAYGQWRGADGVIERENSRILIVLHPDTEEVDRRLELVRESYKRAFRQEAVLRVTAPARASF